MEKRRNFKPEEKAKIVIEILKEEKTLNEIAAEYEIHPNQLSRWKAEFLNNAGRAFSKETDEIEKVKQSYEKEKAIKKHGTPEIMNSDQGSQFTSDEYINILKSNSIKISMDGKHRALDNQRIERFFRSYKWEKLYLEEYENGHQLYKITQEYIEYYNNVRPHQSLDDQTPAQVYYGRNYNLSTAV